MFKMPNTMPATGTFLPGVWFSSSLMEFGLAYGLVLMQVLSLATNMESKRDPFYDVAPMETSSLRKHRMRHLLPAAVLLVLAGCSPKSSPPTEVKDSEVYQNPVDNKTYVAPGGWKVYLPDNPRPKEPGLVADLSHIH